MKRLIAFFIAVTLFFSFTVPALAAADFPVGVSDVPMLMSARSPAVMAVEPVSPPVNGDYLDGTFSFLGQRVEGPSSSSSSWLSFGNSPNYTVPADCGKRIVFYGIDSYKILSPDSSYLLSFRSSVPVAPSRVILEFRSIADTSTFYISSTDFSYSGGLLSFDLVFSPNTICYFRSFIVDSPDSISSSFTGTVSAYSITNLSTMSFENISSAKSASTYDGYNSSGSGVIADSVSMGTSFKVPRSGLVNGVSYGYCRVAPDIDTYLSHVSEPDLFYFKAVIKTNLNLNLDVRSVECAGEKIPFECEVLPRGVVVSGIFDVSKYVTRPYISLVWYGDGELAPADIWFYSFDYCRLDDLYTTPSVVSGDSGLAAWIGSFFSNMYNSLIGFFVSQDHDTEKDFDDSYNPAVDQGISEAQSNITAAEEFEQGIFSQADSAMSQINPGGVQTPSTLINSMAFISGLWTDSYNQLPSDFQFVITFPLFLGIALMFIGRSGRVWGGMMSTRSKPPGNYINGQRVTVIDAKYFH